MLDLLELNSEPQPLEQQEYALFSEVIESGLLTPDKILIASALEILQAREDFAILEAAAVYN